MRSIDELCRVAREARIFPIMELWARKSRHLGKVIERLIDRGYECIVEQVAYEFQKGGNEMLRVTSPGSEHLTNGDPATLHCRR